MPTVSLPAVESGASKASFGDGTFLRQVERNIALLGGQRFLRISLFRFEFVGVTAAEIGSRVRHALASLGMVGLLPDGSLGLFYVSPRPSAQEDLAVERSMADKINRILALNAPSDARIQSVTAAHRWADEVGGVDELIDEALFISAARPHSPAAFRKAS